MKNIKFSTLFVLTSYLGLAQTPQPGLTHTVVNTAGSNTTIGSSFYYSDNVGEVFVTNTVNPVLNLMISEGYLQPFKTVKKPVIVPLPVGFKVDGIMNHLKCKDRFEDAFIKLEVTPGIATYTAQYFWTPSKYCPTNDCSTIDSLNPGLYSVVAKFFYINKIDSLVSETYPISFVINNNETQCHVKPYNGVTANGNGKNDIFYIEDIDKYPNNKISIFDRWGNLIFNTDKYDNKNNAWPKKDEAFKYSATTFFYILNLGKDDLGNEIAPIKGWFEFMKDE